MYFDHNLESSPPRSQFRRPWSPEPFDPDVPSTSYDDGYRNSVDGLPYTRAFEQEAPRTLLRKPQREPSDVSVEALDLADYAKTLRGRQAEDPYPPFPSDQSRSSSFPILPVVPGSSKAASRSGRTRESISPPSRIPTLSSAATHRTHETTSTPRGRQPYRRPYSMPPPSSYASSSRAHIHPSFPPPSTQDHNSSHNLHPALNEADQFPTQLPPSEEIDISHFPRWSRNWYAQNNNSSSGRYNSYNSALPPPFDPGYMHDPNINKNSMDKEPYSYPYNSNSYDIPPPPPLSSLGNESSRSLVPWSGDPSEYGPPLDSITKEGRMRLLEREFGAKAAKAKARDDARALVDADGKPLIGTVDEKGNLVTIGPTRRVVFRALEILLTAGACVPVIYAAVAIKQDPKNPPPPAGKLPVYILYVLSSLFLLFLLYLFVIRPCFISKPRSASKHPFGPAGAAANMGMMVLPMNGGGPGKKPKKPKPGKKGNRPGGQQGEVHVNLIVDPTAFQHPEDEESDEEDSFDEDAFLYGGGVESMRMPGGYQHPSQFYPQKSRKTKRKAKKRRGHLEGIAMEQEWKAARAWLKKLVIVDVAGLALWGAEFVYIMTGLRCPSGQFNGWCNTYNVSTASACLLSVAFGVSLFFDVQDLHASKQSPRTRSNS